jgi:hypothetical protein
MQVENGENYDRETLEIFKKGLTAELSRVTTDVEGQYINFKNVDQLVGLVLTKLFDGQTHTGAPKPNMVKDNIKAKAKIGGVLKEINLIYSVNFDKHQYYAVALEAKDVAWS